MQVTRTSLISQRTHTVDLPITADQLTRYEGGGIAVQDAFPELSDAQREFIKTGITEQEWSDTFGDDDE